MFKDKSDWLQSMRKCIAQGGDLAKIESAAENAVVSGLMSKQNVKLSTYKCFNSMLQWMSPGLDCKTLIMREHLYGVTAHL